MLIRCRRPVGSFYRPLPFPRAQLRSFARLLERLALAAVPIAGAAACSSPPPDNGAVVMQDLASPATMCSLLHEECLWLTAVDFGVPSDASYSWPADGPDPCAPCAFGGLPGVRCGCSVTTTICGVTYVCSTAECSDACQFVGRRPSGLVLPFSSDTGEGAGEWFARQAHLEAASVPAFAQLIRELEAHDAPARLMNAAYQALRDEERHARIFSTLARAAGTRIPAVEVAPMCTRSLSEIAHENAIEGCIRESLGALVAARQACLIDDPVLKDVLTRVAVDETRHANLAWAIDEWAWSRLSPDDRGRIANARTAEARAVISV